MSDDELDQDLNYDPQEEVVRLVAKAVDLPEVQTVTGEEDQLEVASFRAKLYRFKAGQWRERAVGQLRFLKSRASGLTRLLMRADRTKKIAANQLLKQRSPFHELQQLKCCDRAWSWLGIDFSEGEPRLEKLSAKLTTKQQFRRFQLQFEASIQYNLDPQPVKQQQLNSE